MTDITTRADITPPSPPSPQFARLTVDDVLPRDLASNGIQLIGFRSIQDNSPVTLGDLLVAPTEQVEMGVQYPGVEDIEWHGGTITTQIGYAVKQRRHASRWFVWNPIGGRVLWVIDEPGLPDWETIANFPDQADMIRDLWLAVGKAKTIGETVIERAGMTVVYGETVTGVTQVNE